MRKVDNETKSVALSRPQIVTGTALFGLALLTLSLHAGAAEARAERADDNPRVATVATVRTADFRVAIVATRVDGGGAPTADVRLGIAKRVGSGWRERREVRLKEIYFWRTVTGPRAVCRLQVATARSPEVGTQLLQSSSLGCGPLHRIPLPRS
jgi:hypothetical protein